MQVGHEQKKLLIEEVLKKGRKIKIVAEELDINYSNAKHIVKKYQKTGKVGKKKVLLDEEHSYFN